MKTINNPECKVPEAWLMSLMALSERVKKQIDKLPPESQNTFFITDISALIGYISSVGTIIKYNIIKSE